MKTTTSERVAVFSRTSFTKMGAFTGISFDADHYMRAIKWGQYADRPEVETNTKFLQIVCYVLVVCGSKILRYQRGKRGDESRLHNLFSIGIGGHINKEDCGYQSGVIREIIEELGPEFIPGPGPSSGLVLSPTACLYDPSTAVGAAHFGFVHVLKAQSEDVAAHCASIVKPEFLHVSILEAQAVHKIGNTIYERWSQICLSNIGTILQKAK